MSDTKKGFVPSTFKDAGTGETFEGGQEHSFKAGAYDNYLAAGLIDLDVKAAKAAAAPDKPTPPA